MRITRYIRENPIAARLLGLIILCSSVITLMAILLQLYGNFHEDVATLERRLDQVRISTLASITKSIWGFDQEQLNLQVEGVLDVQDVVQVQVNWHDWNNTEQVLVATHPSFSADAIDKQRDQFLVRTYPLVYEEASTPSQQLGTLTITASLTGIYDKLWERALFIAGVQTAKTLLISIFILWLVHALLTRHMVTIAQYARQLHLDNLTTPLRLKRIKIDHQRDELDNVVDAINHMRETLLEDIEQRHTIELALLSEKQEKLETRRQKDAAEDANRAKSQFLATMSHEIRTPMNGVIGMLEMLRDTPLNSTQKHYIDVIHRSGETLLEIINDILDYSKIEAGKMQLDIAVFDLEDLVDDCIQLFSATARKRGIELAGSVAPGTPLLLKGDPTRLRQIIINLLGNAFKFTTDGFITLYVERVAVTPTEKPMLHFAVEDSGIGIDAGVHSYLFDSFNQADTSTARQYGGTGLGLAICKSLAQLMGGDIGVTSIKGLGSTFWFTAQFTVADLEMVSAPKQEVANVLAQRKLLLADNSRLPRQMLASHCHSWGVEMVVARSGAEAMAQLAQASTSDCAFDFIGVGQNLPDMGPLDLARKLRVLPEAENLPLFFIGVDEMSVDAQTQEELAIHSILRKPVSMRVLKLELAALLGQDIRTQALPAPDHQDKHAFSHLHVLVAEDNAVNRMVIKGLLGKLNIEPVLVEDGLAAFNAVRQASEPYDLILMDCEMPDMDGFEATRSIREFERSRNRPPTPIIALTAHALPEHREAVFASGMNYYLAKPITLDSLYNTFQKAGFMKEQ